MRQSILISIIVICGFLLIGCKGSKQSTRTGPPKTDVEFAKEVFGLLANGDMAAAELVDWDHLKMAGIDVGENHRSISDEASRERFQKGFINGYSNSFKSSGGRPEAVTNWREKSKDSTTTIVAADGPTGKTFLMTITHADGQQKLAAIDLQ